MVLLRLLSEVGDGIGHDLLYILLYWIAAYLSDVLAQITRLSPLLFYLMFGVIYSNCEIVERSATMHMLSEVAITFVFFSLGFEENVAHFLGGVKKAWGIATIGAAVPFAAGFGCSYYFWPEEGYKPSMMCGLSVTATAVSLTMITLKTKNLHTSKAAIGILTSAVLDDVLALILVAIMVPIASGEAEPTLEGILFILGKTAVFFLIIAVSHLIIFPHDLSGVPCLKHIPIVRSLGVNQILKFHSGEQAVLVSLSVGVAMGLIAEVFGFHPAIGAYMAGLILEEHYYVVPKTAESDERHMYHDVKDILENAAFVWLGPIFFVQLGTEIELNFEAMSSVVKETLTLFGAIFVAQVLAAMLAARYVPGGFTWVESLMIGFGMLGRAELFFVVLDICHNKYQIFTQEMFYSLTFAAVMLNIMVPITISLYAPIYLRAAGVSNVAHSPQHPEILLTPTGSRVIQGQEVEESREVFSAGSMPLWRSRYGRRLFF